MILSISRWRESDYDYLQIESDIDYNVVQMHKYYYTDDGRLITKIFNLNKVSKGLYRHKEDRSIQFLDKFKIYSNIGVLASFDNSSGNNKDAMDDDLNKNGRISIPIGPAESRDIYDIYRRVWNAYDWYNGNLRLRTSTGVSTQHNALQFNAVVSDNNLFVNCFNMDSTNRDNINAKMNSDPLILFESGNFGNAEYIPEEDKVVIVMSNGVSNYKEEFNSSDFINITAVQAWNSSDVYISSSMYGVGSADLVLKRYRPVSVSFYPSLTTNVVYPNTTIRNEIVSYERLSNVTSVPKPVYNLSAPPNDSFVRNYIGGSMKSPANFARYNAT